jgi:hypothetical protein
MYGEVPAANIVPPVVATGAAIALPTTGADGVTTLAVSVGAGLVTWGLVYLYTAKVKALRG